MTFDERTENFEVKYGICDQTIIDRTSPSLMKPIYSSLLILKNLFIFINLKTTLTMKSHFN